MAKISSYAQVASPALSDMLIGTDVNDSNKTKNFTGQQLLSLLGGGSTGAVITLPEYADNAAALAGGLVTGQLYRTGGAVKVVTP
tara:strand:- start:3485 stop:3739 length:255 start_codon:yes stop_codon:yes gene_type:complete